MDKYKELLNLQFRKMVADPMIPYFIFFQPVIFVLLFGFIKKLSNPDPDLGILIVGVTQMIMWQVLLYSGGVIVRHEFNRDRTIFYNLLSPTNLFEIWSVRLIICCILSLPSFCVSYITGFLAFNNVISLQSFFLIVVGLILFFVTTFSIGISLILILFLNPHGGKVIQTISYPIFLLSGMIIPVNQLPKVLEIFSYIFPLTWGVKFTQDLVAFNFNSAIQSLAISILVSLIYLLIAYKIYIYVINNVIEKGKVSY